MVLEQAKKHIHERDEENRQRYLNVYGIDIYDHDTFDLCINNEKITPEQSMELVLTLLKLKNLKLGARITKRSR
jgi:cytidylate kinase